MTTPVALAPGQIHWAFLEPVGGREQGGRRPVLVVSSDRFLEVVDTLVAVVPITSVDRGWGNHVGLGELQGRPSWAMTEQVRTLSRSRLRGQVGTAPAAAMAEVWTWLRESLGP